ncbi:hypothetical protein BJX68DRAFT_62877 [Aspergillus pseudodeflectus]|uniref:Uncharacterized protein n=1 Tax=Aspergillus pseudodeflectus TaxID=176178 RepID=A0ABR4KJ43_9EURO
MTSQWLSGLGIAGGYVCARCLMRSLGLSSSLRRDGADADAADLLRAARIMGFMERDEGLSSDVRMQSKSGWCGCSCRGAIRVSHDTMLDGHLANGYRDLLRLGLRPGRNCVQTINRLKTP